MTNHRKKTRKYFISLIAGVMLIFSITPTISALASEVTAPSIDLTSQETIDSVFEGMKEQTNPTPMYSQSTSTSTTSTTAPTYTKEEVAALLKVINDSLPLTNTLDQEGINLSDDLTEIQTVEIADDGTRTYTNFTISSDSVGDSQLSKELNNYYFPSSKVSLDTTYTTMGISAGSNTVRMIAYAAAISVIVEILIQEGYNVSKSYLTALAKTAFMKKGWVEWKRFSGISRWTYMDNYAVTKSKWVLYSGNWYWMNSKGLMHDPTLDGEWKVINKKWYQFVPRNLGGEGKIYKKEGWDYDYYKKTGKWIYFIPGLYGLATNESRYINGKTYYFDSNGICLNP